MSTPQEGSKLIDLGAFERLCTRLAEALSAFKADPANLFILDAVVKRFELSYELAIRSLRRYLLDYSASQSEVDSLTFQEMIRRGDELGLLANGWSSWKQYRDARNETAHSYTEAKAREIAAEAEIFLAEAQYLLENLKRRTANHG